MKRSEAIQSQIDNIMDTFNFRRCHEMMLSVDWSWGIGGERHTPEEWELRQQARSMMKAAVKTANTLHSSGGFSAICRDEDQYIRIDLSFGEHSMEEFEAYE